MATKHNELFRFLRFDPKLEKGVIARYLANPRLVILLLIFVIGLGVNAFVSIPRELNPEIKIPIVLVSTVLPGASPTDVESLITIPIEDSINSLENVKTMTSSSQDNVSVVNIEFGSGIDPEKAKTDVQAAVDGVTLPTDAMDPNVIKLDFQNAPVWTFAITTTADEGSLFKFAKNLEQKLEDMPEIDTADISGLEKTEIQIIVNPQTYASFGVNPLSLSQTVTGALKSFPAGTLKTDNYTFALTIDPAVTTIADIRNLHISLAGQNVLLSDIAEVSERPKPDQGQSFIAYPNESARRSVTFNVLKSKTVSINKAVTAAEKMVDTEIENTHGIIKAVSLLNTSEEIDHQFRDLTRDFLITVFLVVAVLFIFLGPRQALVSSLSAPLSFLITFIVMQQTGITLNFLSLFSLILSLGLLVDDTVVIISAMSSYYKTGRFTPLQAALLVWRDFLVPVFTTTITTVWAFLPLLLATGIIGEFIKSIPIVVSTALIASFVVAMFITLPLIVIILKPQIPNRISVFLKIVGVVLIGAILLTILPKGNLFLFEIIALGIFIFVAFTIRKELGIFTKKVRSNISNRAFSKFKGRDISDGVISFEGVQHAYRNLIASIIGSKRNRRLTTTMVIIFSIFSFALVPFGFVQNEFFPKTDAEQLSMTIEMPSGTYIDETKKESLKILNRVKQENGIKYVSLDLGRGISDFGGSAGAGSNTSLITINLLKKNSSFVAEKLRSKYDNFPKGKLNVVEQSGGPPAGADVQIKLLGDDLGILNKKSDEVSAFLAKQNGITNVNKSIKEGTSKLTFTPDKALMSESNISNDQLGLALRLYSSGFTVDTNKFPGSSEDQDITLRLYPTSAFVTGINEILLPTMTGNVPLTSLGKVELKQNPTLIAREDGKRTISISAAVTRGFNIQEKNQDLEKFAKENLNLPQGYEWKTGGVNQQNDESVQSILQAMLLSFMLIIVTMVIQFSSFRRALIVMLVIPLSISGVFVIFALTKTPLSFPALIGMLALFGIVVKNSILLVDKILENQKHNMGFVESISDASASRLEPIMLTSIATILGLIPITLTDPLWRGLGGAIIAGLSFSGLIMLFFIPVTYYSWFAAKEKNK